MAAYHRQRNLLVLLLGVVCAAILLLAVLQYYLIDQISDGYRQRMQATLHTGVTHFGEDFDRELALAYLSLQMDAETFRARNWDRYAARYQRWSAHAAYPGLVQSVYLAELYSGRRASLMRFDPVENGFATSAWPDSLVPLREQFALATRSVGDDQSLLPVSPIAADLPALVVPLSRVVKLSDQQELAVEANLIFGDDIISSVPRRCANCRGVSSTPLFAYTIIVLDRRYLTETFIPALAQRHFGNGGVLDYNLLIVDRAAPTHIVYQSNARASATAPGVPDDATAIFDLRLDAFSSLLASAASENDSPRSDPLSERLMIGVYGSNSTGQRQQVASDSGGRWKLILTHRDGSLDAAVGALRLRTMVLSGAILLLLAASVGVIIVATRRAQRLARQQMAFAAGVSHELRTPLAVICSAGENLADGVVRDPQQTRQYGAVIHNEGRRLAAMVEQVLEFAGAQAQQKRTVSVLTDMRAAVERAIACCCPLPDQQRYQFVLDIPTNLPPVLVDEAMLLRALQNLIDNAMKYGGEQPWIGISAREEYGLRGREVWISVCDRGIGILPSDLPHIFEPFYRAATVTDAQIHGSGLGLSLVQHIAEALGGQVTVASTPGRGSTFALVLPVAADAAVSMLSVA